MKHVLLIYHTYVAHRFDIRIVYVIHAFLLRLVYVAHVFAMCCTCVSHMLNICLLSVVNLGYVCVPPRQAPIEGSPESFWDSAKIYLIYFCLSLRFAASAIVFKITTGITTG